MGSLPISQCPCHPEEEGRKQHGDPWSPVRGSEALRRPCCGRDAERPGQGSPARPPRRQLPQPGLEGPRQPEAVRTRPGRPGRLYLSPVPQSTSCPETDWTCLHMAWSPPLPVLPGNSARPGVCVCVMKGHSQTLWASDSPHSQALPSTTVDVDKPHSFWASVSLLVNTSEPPGNHGGGTRVP